MNTSKTELLLSHADLETPVVASPALGIIMNDDPRYGTIATNFQISLKSDVCMERTLVDARVRETLLITISLLVIAILVIGPFTYFEQLVNADSNNGNDKKSCSNHQSGNGNCSHKDSTPFILPFP